ncbi:hypothetical protein D029_3390 [Vibrio parahaemolyticus 970107]|nr:hypothetical protein D029_3390 [Vibrio parahaemolyticus 970107]
MCTYPFVFYFTPVQFNAQLRGEARNTDVAAWHFNTQINA